MEQTLLEPKKKKRIKTEPKEEPEPKEKKYTENYFIKEKLKDKKVIIVIEHDYTSDWYLNILDRKPEEHLNGWFEGDYGGFIGGCGSECWEKKGEEKLTLQEIKKQMIKWLKDDLLEDGYNEKNISVKELPFNKEEELKKWKEQYKKELEREKEYSKREIERYKKPLTKAIKIKNVNIDDLLNKIKMEVKTKNGRRTRRRKT